ncbi:MAG: hypothetical protein JNM24_07380 [Bdellovibrionaceae bacterium]|nr:hypothetical protein [Pseudobdellovibrionaceae bacterium]
MLTKTLLHLFCFGFIQSGCTSFAHSPYACDSATEKAGSYQWAYVFFGNITQLGDCAISKTLKVEMGEYYYYNKEKIDHEVEMKFSDKEGYELNHFARAFNCNSESFARFHSEIFKKKDDIFGKNFDASARVVTKAVQQLIENDEILSKLFR